MPDEAITALTTWVSTCDSRAGEKAVRVLRRAHAARPNDIGLMALLGVSLARGPTIQVIGAAGVLYRAARPGTAEEKEAVRLLLEAGKAERWPEIGRELALLGLATRRVETLTAGAGLLEVNAADAGDSAMLSEIRLALGELAHAAAAVEGAEGRHDASAMRALGIARLRAGDEAGAKLYFDGLINADSTAIALYLDDMRCLLTLPEVTAWSESPLADKRDLLRWGWEWRAAEATLTVPERLMEHFRRLYFAYEHHTRQSYRGALPFNGLWRHEYIGVPRLDDRGIVYVRHGPPDKVARMAFPGSMEETWLYAGLAGGVATIPFTKDVSAADWYVPDLSAARAPERLSRVRTGSDQMRRLAQDSYGETIRNFLYTKVPCGNIWGCAADGLNEVFGRNRWAHAIFESETARPRLTVPLNAILNTYAFRGRGDITDVAVLLSLEGQRITPEEAGEAVRYRLRLFAAVEDSITRAVVRNDSMVSIDRTRRLGPDDVVRYTTTLGTPPTAGATIWTSVRNQLDSIEGQVLTMRRSIPAFPRATSAAGEAAVLEQALAISDLVVAEVSTGTWQRSGVQLEPIAGHRLLSGAPFRLFYEVYGVRADDAVDVSIEVTPDRPSGILGRISDLIARREAISLRFQEPVQFHAPDMAVVIRDIHAELEPGEYTLMVTVTRQRDHATSARTTKLMVYSRN